MQQLQQPHRHHHCHDHLALTHTHPLPMHQVKELIKLVEPEVVGVELCKDRLPLLIDAETDTSPNIWHCRTVSGEGSTGRLLSMQRHGM